MRCPYCGAGDTQVKDSRPSEDDTSVRRRRACAQCGARFTTFERVQLRDLVVVKRDGRRVPFDRDKLTRSIGVAVRKRNVNPEQLDQMVSGIVRKLESLTDGEVATTGIGELVMEALAEVDPVGYVRYASVYKDFQDPQDFAQFIKTQSLVADEDVGEAD
jgi:transcriptional repressor NrdR